ncbi:hypothetical protein CUZ95_2726 [Enterococcus lactis]|nr:hypothetical protein [Enterococcus lactis]
MSSILTFSERLEDIRLEFLDILFTVWLASPINLIPYADNPAISKTSIPNKVNRTFCHRFIVHLCLTFSKILSHTTVQSANSLFNHKKTLKNNSCIITVLLKIFSKFLTIIPHHEKVRKPEYTQFTTVLSFFMHFLLEKLNNQIFHKNRSVTSTCHTPFPSF